MIRLLKIEKKNVIDELIDSIVQAYIAKSWDLKKNKN